MNKRHLSLLAAASIALFSACSNTVENADLQAKLNVLVRDASDGSPIAGAKVKLLSGGESTTNAEGIASFGGLSGGTHSLRIDKDGYASITVIEEIETVPNTSNEASTSISLYPLSAKLIGYAYYQDNKGNLKPAKGATIRFTFYEDFFVNKSVDAIVDDDGKYEFSALPSSSGDVSALEYLVGDVAYAGPSSSLTLIHGGTKPVNDIILLKINVGSFILLNYTQELADSSASVVLNFSDSIDVTKNTSSTIQISPASPTDIVYSNHNKTMTIKPLGKWARNFNIIINGLTSGNGIIYSTPSPLNVSVGTVLVPDISAKKVVPALSAPVTVSDHDFKISWNEVQGATDYTAYIKKSSDNTYTEYNNQNYPWLEIVAVDCKPTGNGTVVCELTICPGSAAGTPFANSNKVYVVVQGKNSISKTNITDVTPLEVKAQ